MKTNRTISILLGCLTGVCLHSFQATAGTLTGSLSQPFTQPSVDLTAEGSTDWIHVGDADDLDYTIYNFDGDPGAQNISQPVQLGNPSDTPGAYGSAIEFSYSNGALLPVSDTNNSGIYVGSSVSDGWQFTYTDPDTTPKVMKIYCSPYYANLSFVAHLSDGSAPDYTDNSFTDTNGDGPNGVYTILFAPDNPGATLTITMTMTASNGEYANVALMAATVSSPDARILIQPVSQATNIVSLSQQFSVSSAGDAPTYYWYEGTPGSSTLLSDAGQYSGTTTPTLTISNLTLANAGNYFVVVSNSYNSVTSALANLTVLPIGILTQPVSATNWLGQTQQLSVTGAGDALTYQWYEGTPDGSHAALSDGGEISGTTSNVLNFDNLTLADATNYYVVLADSSNDSVTSSVVTLQVFQVTGTLIGTVTPIDSGAFDLTASGNLDWAHWGLNAPPDDFDDKVVDGNPVGLISDITLIGPDPTPQINFDGVLDFSWSDGMPNASADTTTGVYINDYSPDNSYIPSNNGYQFTVAAGTNRQVLTVYAGCWYETCDFTATLSDNSHPIFSDASLVDDNGAGQTAIYTVDFAAGSPGQTLTITVYGSTLYGNGNISLFAATLAAALAPPTLQFSREGSSLQLNWTSGTLLQSTNVSGPWTPTAGAAPPSYTVPMTAPQMFYRLQAP